MPRVCPWYIGYFLINPLRKLVQNPAKIVAPYVKSGNIVFEPGPGMGYFTLEMARRVGPEGRVYATDIQPVMLNKLRQRAARAGVVSQIETRQADSNSFGVDDIKGQTDFVLAFAVVHEMPSFERFFEETSALLKKGGRMLVAEPQGHVSVKEFEEELTLAKKSGFHVVDNPPIWSSRTALLEKK